MSPFGWLGRGLGLRARLTLLLGVTVLLTVALAWFLTGRAVLEPFTRDLVRAHLDHVAFLAEQVERGASPAELGERLGLELRRVEHPPRMVRRALREALREGHCRRHEVRGREIVACRGPMGGAATRIASGGWLVVRRALDPDAPGRRIASVLVAVAGLVLVASAVIATFVIRPIRTSIEAMERVAGGDLEHRLPESSSPDIAEVARAFNRMAERVRGLLEAERGLMAGISHELRTPLARLRLELELLHEHIPDARWAAMEADLGEIDTLIGEVLESSRLAIGERKLDLQAVDLRAVVEEALGNEPLPDHEVRLSGEAAPVRGDHARLVRVVRNLLQNAGKYAPAESVVEVRVEGRSVEVADRGPGVPAAELSRLFEPFFRGERGRASGAKGHGLGLMIAKQVVDLHGGTLEVENREGGGLRVRLELPTDEGSERPSSRGRS